MCLKDAGRVALAKMRFVHEVDATMRFPRRDELSHFDGASRTGSQPMPHGRE
jgi:hypothetical protein